jgi:restriction endonuclease S subunit
VSGFAAGSGDQTEATEGVPHLRPTNITATGEVTLAGSKFVPDASIAAADFLNPGEILFNNTNSTLWVGKSAVFNLAESCACSNHITRVRLTNPKHSPTYFAGLLNSLRSMGYFAALATNFNNQAGINADTLGRLRLPVPAPKLQLAIAAEIDRRNAESRKLRVEARAGWAKAQQAFEDALLGPAS